MSETKYVIYLKEEYNQRMIINSETLALSEGGAFIKCNSSSGNEEFLIPATSIYYIKLLDEDDEIWVMGGQRPLEPIFDRSILYEE